MACPFPTIGTEGKFAGSRLMGFVCNLLTTKHYSQNFVVDCGSLIDYTGYTTVNPDTGWVLSVNLPTKKVLFGNQVGNSLTKLTLTKLSAYPTCDQFSLVFRAYVIT